MRNFGMAGSAGELIDDLAIPLQAQPAQAIKNGRNRRIGGAFAVGIFNAQQHLAAEATGVKPVEQSCTRPANMQKARGRGSKAGDNRVRHE